MRKLEDLISGKDFERYQSGLRTRFRKFNYRYEYGLDNDDVHYLKIQLSTSVLSGEIYVTERGLLSLLVCEKQSGNTHYSERVKIKNADEFFKLYPKVFIYLRDYSAL